MSNSGIGLMMLAGALAYSAPASAAATEFDCDVPPDHFSSVSQDVVGPMAIRGSIQVVQLRSGNNLPVAGARLVSSDGSNSISFQLVAASAHAKEFDVVLNTKRGGDLNRSAVAKIPVDQSVTFSLSVDDTGKAALAIGGSDFDASFIPLSGGKEMAFCSTAQFKFSGLLFSSVDGVRATGAH